MWLRYPANVDLTFVVMHQVIKIFRKPQLFAYMYVCIRCTQGGKNMMIHVAKNTLTQLLHLRFGAWNHADVSEPSFSQSFAMCGV